MFRFVGALMLNLNVQCLEMSENIERVTQTADQGLERLASLSIIYSKVGMTLKYSATPIYPVDTLQPYLITSTNYL